MGGKVGSSAVEAPNYDVKSKLGFKRWFGIYVLATIVTSFDQTAVKLTRKNPISANFPMTHLS